MKKIIKYLFLLLTTFGCSLNADLNLEKVSEKDQVILNIIDAASDEIREKYPLSPAGFGMNHGFEHISITFELFENKSRDELRSILLDGTQIFLRKLNESEKARLILPNYPATQKNVGIDIFIHGKENYNLFHPNFFCAAISKGELSFLSRTEENRYVVHEEITETYEEALDLIKQQLKNKP